LVAAGWLEKIREPASQVRVLNLLKIGIKEKVKETIKVKLTGYNTWRTQNLLAKRRLCMPLGILSTSTRVVLGKLGRRESYS